MSRIIISLESPPDDPSRVHLRVEPTVTTLLQDDSPAADAALIVLDALHERFETALEPSEAGAEAGHLSARTS